MADEASQYQRDYCERRTPILREMGADAYMKSTRNQPDDCYDSDVAAKRQDGDSDSDVCTSSEDTPERKTGQKMGKRFWMSAAPLPEWAGPSKPKPSHYGGTA